MSAGTGGIHWPRWARRTHPIVQNETRYWAQSRAWRGAEALLWVGAALFIITPAASSLLINLPNPATNRVTAVLMLGGFFTLGLALLSGLAVWFTNLSATILSATLIARERESQTWPFLRLTAQTSRDIVGGKLTALFATLIGPAGVIIGLRLLALAAGVATLALAVLAGGVTTRDVAELFGPFFQQFALSPGEWLGVAGFGLLAGLWTLFNWLSEPLFGLVYYGAVGLSASTLARSRGAAIVLAFGAHFCLALGLYVPASQLNSLLLLPVLASNNDPTALGLVALLSLILQFIIQTLLPWAVVVGCLALALQRVEAMGD